MKFVSIKEYIAGRKELSGWLLGLAFLLLYIFLPFKVFFNYDPYLYASETISPFHEQWFNPHHLLFSRTHWLFFELIHLFSPKAGVLSTMSWLNAIFGALGLVLFYRLVLKLSARAYISILLTLALGTSLGFYLYSTVGEIVVPTCFWLLLTLTMVLEGAAMTFRRSLATGLCFAAALLFHESASIYIVLVIAILLMRSLPAQRLGNLAIFISSIIVPVITAYALVLIFAEGLPPTEWYRWLSGMIGTGAWLRGTPDKFPLAMAYWLNTANHVFLLPIPRPGSLWWWFLLNKIATWGLVAFPLAAVIAFTRKKNYLGLMILANILIAIVMVIWWEYNCWDFYVFPFILLLLLIAWGAHRWWAFMIAGWLIFYLPLTALFNWQSYLDLVTNPRQEVLARSVNNLSRIYGGRDVLVLNSYDCLSEICVFSRVPSLYSREFQTENEMLQLIIQRLNESRERELYTVVSDEVHQAVLNNPLQDLTALDRKTLECSFKKATLLMNLHNELGQKVQYWELGKPEPDKMNDGQK